MTSSTWLRDGGKSPHPEFSSESLQHLFSCFFLKQFIQIKGVMIFAHSHLLEDPGLIERYIFIHFEHLRVEGDVIWPFSIPFLKATVLVWTLMWLHLTEVILFLAHLAEPKFNITDMCVCWVVWQAELFLRFNHGHRIRSQILVLECKNGNTIWPLNIWQ